MKPELIPQSPGLRGYMLLIALFFLSTTAWQTALSQSTTTVSGTVVAPNDNEGLPGVNVLVKGTSQGTVTDIDGKYTINVPNSDDILVFYSMGFVSQEVPVEGRSTIDITMAEDVQALDEIVVIGYGTQKRSDLTGAVGSVDVEQLQERPDRKSVV